MGKRYPIIRPTLPAFEEVREDLDRAITSRMVTTGPLTREFEARIADLLEVRNVVALSSCTSGLALALRAMRLEGEVLVPSFTFTATALAVVWAGLEPVFCDCNSETLTLDPAAAADAIGPNTVAMMPVPVFGMPADNDRLLALAKERGLRVLFDSAQALGSQYRGQPLGGFGDGEVFSLSPTKVLTAVEGGLFTTNDDELAATLRRMRDYGKGGAGDIVALGLSARFSELHAAIGKRNVERLPDLIAARRARISFFQEALEDVEGLRFLDEPDCRTTNGIYMVLRVDAEKAACDRDSLMQRLDERGVDSRPYFSPPLHQQSVYRSVEHRVGGSLENTERAARECLAIPLYADMTEAELSDVASRVRGALA